MWSVKSIKLNNNSFQQNTYYLNCDICENYVIDFMLSYPATCLFQLSVDTKELKKLLDCNGYDEEHDFFKTKEDAEKIANYINACVLLHQLKM